MLADTHARTIVKSFTKIIENISKRYFPCNFVHQFIVSTFIMPAALSCVKKICSWRYSLATAKTMRPSLWDYTAQTNALCSRYSWSIWCKGCSCRFIELQVFACIITALVLEKKISLHNIQLKYTF